jgi:hypothetical protein
VQGLAADNMLLYGLLSIAAKSVKELNFLTAREPKKTSPVSIRYAAAVVSILAVTGSLGTYVYTTTREINQMQKQIELYEAYTYDPAVIAAADAFYADQFAAQEIFSVLNEIAAYQDIVSDTAILGRNTVAQTMRIFGLNGFENSISQLKFSESDKTASFELFLRNPRNISIFVERLRQSDIYNGIGYVGYAESERYHNNLMGYSFKLVCRVKGVKPVG